MADNPTDRGESARDSGRSLEAHPSRNEWILFPLSMGLLFVAALVVLLYLVLR